MKTIPTPWPPRLPPKPKFALLMPHTCLLHLWALFLPSLTLLPGTCLMAVNAHPSRMPDSRTFWGRGGQGSADGSSRPCRLRSSTSDSGGPCAPQKAKDGRREKGGPQESLTHPGTAAVEKAQVVECAWGPPGPLTCHPSSPSGESLGWFPRLCRTSAIIYFWQQIPHAVPDFLCSTICSLLQQPSPQKKAPERSKCSVSYYISKLLSVITLLKK